MGIEKISYETEGRRYKSEGENYSGVLKLLEVLLSPEKEPEKKKKILEEDFKIEMTTEILGFSMERSFEILAVQEADREEITRLVNEKIQKEQLLYNS